MTDRNGNCSPQLGARVIKQHISDYLSRKGVRWYPRAHATRFTAQEIAASMHVSGKRFAKTVVLVADGRLLLAVIPADEEVDVDRLRDELGTDVRVANEAAMSGHFADCDIGAMPPLGELYGMQVLVDPNLARQLFIHFNAGTHEDTIELAWDEFERLAPVEVVQCARPIQRERKAGDVAA